MKKTKTDAWRGKEKLVGTRRGWSAFSLGDGRAAHFLGTPRGRRAPLRTHSREERGAAEPRGGMGTGQLPGQVQGDSSVLPAPSQTSVPSSQRGKCLPPGKLRRGLRRCPRPGAGPGRAAGHHTGQHSSSGHCRARTALRRRAAAGRKRGRRCREGDRETVTHCGWAGLAGVANARRPAHPSTCRAADRLEPRLLPRSPCQE